MARFLGESIDLSRQAHVKAAQLASQTVALAASAPAVPAAAASKSRR